MAFYSNAPLPDTNARQAATTIRPSSTALLTIDSEDRYTDYVAARANPTSPYNFAISKTESLMPGFMTRLGISEIVFPWTIPNINVKTSKIQFLYALNGVSPVVTTTIDLFETFYTPAELAAELQTNVRALPGNPLPNFLMTYGKDTLGNDAEAAFYYSGNQALTTVAWEPMVPNSAAYPYGPNVRQLFDVLGFSDDQNGNLAPLENGNYTLCQGIRYVDIVCNQLTNSQAQKDQTSQTIARDMLCRVYLGSAPGITSTVAASAAAFCPPGCAPTIIYKNYTSPKQIQWQPNQNIPGYLQFQVYDDSGELLDGSIETQGGNANQTTDWSMTMLISEC
jgi:hypothetical protein